MEAFGYSLNATENSLKRLLSGAWNLSPAYFGTALLIAASLIFRPALLSEAFFWVIIRQAAPLGMVVLGQSMAMRCRSIDLSIGGTVLAVVYVATSPYLASWPGYLIVIAGVCLGLVIGTINGVLITVFRGSAVIVTLAMTIIFVGIVIALARYTPPGEVPSLIRYFGSGRLGGIPLSPIVWIGLVIPVALALRITVFGKYVDAIGSNPSAAAVSGIPHLRVIFLVHVFSGLASAVGGLLLAGFVGMGITEAVIGQDLILNSLAAVILGGVTFGGGKGRIVGPAVGAFMLTFLFNLLTSFSFDESGKLMMQGGIIAVAALIDAVKRHQSRSM
jgi:ribose transport system permease protein